MTLKLPCAQHTPETTYCLAGSPAVLYGLPLLGRAVPSTKRPFLTLRRWDGWGAPFSLAFPIPVTAGALLACCPLAAMLVRCVGPDSFLCQPASRNLGSCGTWRRCLCGTSPAVERRLSGASHVRYSAVLPGHLSFMVIPLSVTMSGTHGLPVPTYPPHEPVSPSGSQLSPILWTHAPPPEGFTEGQPSESLCLKPVCFAPYLTEG